MVVPIFNWKYTTTFKKELTTKRADRCFEKLKYQMRHRENKILIEILDKACDYSNQIIKTDKYNFKNMLIESKVQVDQHNVVIVNILLATEQMPELIEQIKSFDAFDVSTALYSINNVILGYCYGAEIRPIPEVSKNIMYAMADAEFVGVVSNMADTWKIYFVDDKTIEVSFDAGYAIFCPRHVCKAIAS